MGRCTSTGGTTTTERHLLPLLSAIDEQDLLERIIPFFSEHPLRTAKQHDFEKFASCVELIASGRHQDAARVLLEIVEITADDEPK